jgi:hypothetical protein
VAHLREMPLRTLHLGRCLITDGGLRHLHGMSLTDLDLTECPITDGGLTHFKGMPLEIINLTDCTQIRDGGLVHLREMPLRKLLLQRCQITDGGLPHLHGVYLELLELIQCPITDTGLRNLELSLSSSTLNIVEYECKYKHRLPFRVASRCPLLRCPSASRTVGHPLMTIHWGGSPYINEL